jgi:serine/threonine-protein kinase HipA
VAALNIWMNGQLVGVWQRSRSGTHAFRYEDSWLRSPQLRPLSLSIPITRDLQVSGAPVENYFDNLLPDSDKIRKRIQARYLTSSTEAFELLTAIGRDCVGAVQVLPEHAQPEGYDRVEGQRLSEAEIEQHLLSVTATPALAMAQDGDEFRISIAGAQEKTALLRVGSRWCRPLNATPTTHIVKLPLGLIGGRRFDMTRSVENEWLCAQIVAALGLPVAKTEMATFGAQKVLVVERFDRAWMDDGRWIARLPQEDLCQATATPPERKYEAHGGPGIKRCLDLLQGSEEPHIDRARFLCAQLAFWLMAAIDGHAKNFSIFHKGPEAYTLTPLYDVLSAWPLIGTGPSDIRWQRAKLAMAVRSKHAHYNLREIDTRHWAGLATASGVPGVWDLMVGMVARVDTALGKVQARLPADYPTALFDKVAAGMREQAERFTRGLSG